MKKVTIVLTMLAVLLSCAISNAWTPPQLVTSGINTSSNELAPFLSFDGKSLYFSRDDGGFYNIYQATRQGTSGPFTSVTKALDHDGAWNVFLGWVSQDNLRMYYHDESPWTMKVSTRASASDPWTAGTAIPGLSSFTNPVRAKLTQNELTIVFGAYNAPGGIGNYDIWIATRPDTSSPFGNIRNLSEINSSAYDDGPYLSPDGLALYFTSNRNGSGQLFKATRTSLNNSFGNLEHLSFFDSIYGASDPSLSADGTTLYFGRETPGNASDIYFSEVPEPATLLLLGLGAFALKKRNRN